MVKRKETDAFVRTVFGNREEFTNAICKGRSSKFSEEFIEKLEKVMEERVSYICAANALEGVVRSLTLEDVLTDIHDSWTYKIVDLLNGYFSLKRATVANVDDGEVKLVLTFKDIGKGGINESKTS